MTGGRRRKDQHFSSESSPRPFCVVLRCAEVSVTALRVRNDGRKLQKPKVLVSQCLQSKNDQNHKKYGNLNFSGCIPGFRRYGTYVVPGSL